MPNPAPTAENAAQRYARYKMRAVYFNATGRTLAGLIGIAYAKWPEIVTANKTLLQDADGSGVGLIGQAGGDTADAVADPFVEHADQGAEGHVDCKLRFDCPTVDALAVFGKPCEIENGIGIAAIGRPRSVARRGAGRAICASERQRSDSSIPEQF